MTLPPTILERAFQLAKSGKCATVGDIRSALSREGYLEDTLTGPALHKQLRELMRSARTGTRLHGSSQAKPDDLK